MSDNSLDVNLKLIDGKVKFCANSRNNPDLVIDYFPPVGSGNGYTSQELLLISFASCLSTTVITLLRYNMKKEVSDIKVNATGIVRETHPRALSNIEVEFIITSKDLDVSDMQRALDAAEEKLCPLWHLLKGNVDITTKFEIKR